MPDNLITQKRPRQTDNPSRFSKLNRLKNLMLISSRLTLIVHKITQGTMHKSAQFIVSKEIVEYPTPDPRSRAIKMRDSVHI